MKNECDTQQKSSDRALCEECKEKQSNYTCPGCSLRSCSLACVNSHKKRTACTGKRDRTGFVPLSAFDDNKLLSDYNLLEEMKRASDSAKRMRAPFFSHYRLPHQLQILRKAASSRRIQIRFQPCGMSKREKNQSYFDRRKKFIYWTIEWRFHCTDVIVTDHGVREDTVLSSVLEKHLQPGMCDQKLKQFWKVPMESLKFYIRKNSGGRPSPSIQLDSTISLKQQLHEIVVLEYPAIYVFLPSHNIDFEVAECRLRPEPRSNVQTVVEDDQTITSGIAFKVEEIEEDDDLASPLSFNSIESTAPNMTLLDINNDRLENSLDCLPNCTTESQRLESDVPTECQYDLDQDLQDAYTSIMAEMDPDDFLNFDADFVDTPELGNENTAYVPACNFAIGLDLEEGEIADC